ncbi:DNA replication complex GINS protein PSF2 isoform X2 [Petromyzon marinus]|uniref:DNA replication complex GINS protein PSF2 n=1 Tax=Petromyzon marinus TaxID=7757 RepID=A0AAJ7XJ73_PETMA|nr:DNA replication complex GINS protein PSF2 isoform X2 [Petromyzon marinus]
MAESMDPAEVEFLAEEETVTIIPNFSLDKVYLIGGDLGPFDPGLPVRVPLWLAINLKQRQKCRIQAPEWMSVDRLEQLREEERAAQTFTPMPSPHYMELSKLLLNVAADDVPRADEIRALLRDLWDTRTAKLRLSADGFVSQQASHAQLDNLTVMEVNGIRPFFLGSLSLLQRLRGNLTPGATQAESQES